MYVKTVEQVILSKPSASRDAIPFYCRFHDGVFFVSSKQARFTSSPSSASAVIETLRRLGETRRGKQSMDTLQMMKPKIIWSSTIWSPLSTTIDYLPFLSPRRRHATWLNSFVKKTRASDSSTSSRQNRPFLLARPLGRHPQSFRRRLRHEPPR